MGTEEGRKEIDRKFESRFEKSHSSLIAALPDSATRKALIYLLPISFFLFRAFTSFVRS